MCNKNVICLTFFVIIKAIIWLIGVQLLFFTFEKSLKLFFAIIQRNVFDATGGNKQRNKFPLLLTVNK